MGQGPKKSAETRKSKWASPSLIEGPVENDTHPLSKNLLDPCDKRISWNNKQSLTIRYGKNSVGRGPAHQ